MMNDDLKKPISRVFPTLENIDWADKFRRLSYNFRVNRKGSQLSDLIEYISSRSTWTDVEKKRIKKKKEGKKKRKEEKKIEIHIGRSIGKIATKALKDSRLKNWGVTIDPCRW